MNYNELFNSVYVKDQPETLEVALTMLKQAGASQVDSIIVLRSALKITLTEADHLILHSEAWKAEKESTEIFREHFFKAFEEEAELNNDIENG